MEMGVAVSAHKNIDIKKSFFGLKTEVVYVPTNSAVDCYRYEYSPEAEGNLRRLLGATDEKIAEEAKSVGRMKRVDMGNVRLEVAVSADHEFMALLVTKYVDFNYVPVSDVKIYEGAGAQAMAVLFG